MNLLHLLPIHIPPRLGILQPRQLRVRRDHGVDHLADGLFVDLLDVDVQAVDRRDYRLATSRHLGLLQGLVGVAFALGTGPGKV